MEKRKKNRPFLNWVFRMIGLCDLCDNLGRGIVLVLVGVFFCPPQAAIAQGEWKTLGLSSKGTLFYDSATVTEHPAGKKAVWIKFAFSQEGVASLKSRSDRFARAAYVTIPYEINCLERNTACQEGIVYSRDGDPLGPFHCSREGTEGALIFPESLSAEILLDKLCP